MGQFYWQGQNSGAQDGGDGDKGRVEQGKRFDGEIELMQATVVAGNGAAYFDLVLVGVFQWGEHWDQCVNGAKSNVSGPC